MKILFVLRPDSFSKYGGDTLQIEKYVFYLKTKGHICYYTTCLKPDISCNPDIVIITNIDTDIVFKVQLSFIVESKNYKIICHPIHHPKIWTDNISSAYSNIRSINPQYLIEKLLIKFKYKSILRYLISSISNPKTIFYLFKKRNIYNSLKGIDKFIFLSHLEKDFFEVDFKLITNCYAIIPNGIDNNHYTNLKNEKDGILVIGRIEPRKNSVNIAKLLQKSDIKVHFYGKENIFYKYYLKAFHIIIAKSKNIKYKGSLANDKLLQIISSYKLLILASYAEVFPLVELEALNSGINVISTVFTTNKDIYNSNSIVYIHPDKLTIDNIMNHYNNVHYNINIPLWSDIINQLEKEYYECIG